MAFTLEQVITLLEHSSISHRTTAAAVCLLVYETLLSFDRDVELIWSAPWNTIKILFLLSRYMPFIDAGVVLYYILLDGSSHEKWLTVFKLSGTLFALGIGVTELLLTIRTWAVWGKDKRLTIALPILYVVCMAGVLTSLRLFLPTVGFIPPPRDAGAQSAGCFNTGASPVLFAAWVFLMSYDAVMLILMAIRGLPTLKTTRLGHRRLANSVFLNGTFYYLYLFVMSAINVVLIYPYGYHNLLSTFERVMYSILTCRVILDIRGETTSVNDWMADSTRSHARVRIPVHR